jgi:DNA modification methylase
MENQKTLIREKKILEKLNGILDPRNNLNDLTGKEWKFSTRSVISKSYPPNMQMGLRKQHGGQKPPELCADLIKIFTKKNHIVLDPLMGVGGTLLGASLCNRQAIGFEITPEWIDIYKRVCELEGLKIQQTKQGDCKQLLRELEANGTKVDFVLTDVPYWNMDKLEQTRSKNARKTNLNHFNGFHKQTKEEWLEDMKEIFEKTNQVLKQNKYLAVFIGDMYREGEYHFLSGELAKKISEIKGLVLKANLIWYDVSKSLHIYGYPFSFVPSMIHQNILIFQKKE